MKVLEFLKNCIFYHCKHKRSNLIKAFTLAEILIVLTVIGIMTAILLPAIRHTSPKEKIIKFQKAHTTFENAIRELVTSDKYYLDGSLGVKIDGSDIDGSHSGDFTYFCESLGDILNYKSINCQGDKKIGGKYFGEASMITETGIDNLEISMEKFDSNCRWVQITKAMEPMIVSHDGMVFYDVQPQVSFGMSRWDVYKYYYPDSDSAWEKIYTKYFEEKWDGFYRMVKIFCVDIDGFKNGEDPFGYGIRIDGKIYNGKRAQEWIKKSIQEKE